jgi:DNA polymerase-3 subunit gamma/tau
VERPATPSATNISGRSREAEGAGGFSPLNPVSETKGFSPGPSPAQANTSTEGALALAEAPNPQPGPHLVQPQLDLDALQTAAINALANTKGQQSASDKIADSTWTASADTLTIQTTVSPAMLPLLLNADAQNIIKSVFTTHNVKLRLNLLPGVANTTAAPKAKRAPAAGSVADLAAKHPIVQQARELFNAEIQTVIDLRDKD